MITSVSLNTPLITLLNEDLFYWNSIEHLISSCVRRITAVDKKNNNKTKEDKIYIRFFFFSMESFHIFSYKIAVSKCQRSSNYLACLRWVNGEMFLQKD